MPMKNLNIVNNVAWQWHRVLQMQLLHVLLPTGFLTSQGLKTVNKSGYFLSWADTFLAENADIEESEKIFELLWVLDVKKPVGNKTCSHCIYNTVAANNMHIVCFDIELVYVKYVCVLGVFNVRIQRAFRITDDLVFSIETLHEQQSSKCHVNICTMHNYHVSKYMLNKRIDAQLLRQITVYL